jgi:hypothetical protein
MSWRRTLLTGVVLLVGVAVVSEAASRILFASWSIGVGGRPTLTGPWAGPLTTPHGAAFGLYLDLEYKERPGPSYRTGGGALGINNLKGQATLCTPTGERYEYDVSGKADPFGEIGALWLEYGDPSLSGFDMQLTGAWRGDALDLTIVKNPFGPNGRLLAAPASSGVDPDDYFVPVTLTERDRAAFEATCQRIRA